MGASTKLSFIHSKLFTVYQDKLASKITEKGTSFEADIWELTNYNRGKKAVTSLDFNLFDEPHVKFGDYFLATFDNQSVYLTTVELAKVLLLDLHTWNSNSGVIRIYKGLAQVFAFLSCNDIRRVDAANLPALFSWMLLTEVSRVGTRQRLSALSYGSVFGTFDVNRLCITLVNIGLSDMVIEHTTYKQRTKALAAAVSNVTNMSLADYVEGGSFNFLTLDVGRYYVEHVATLFENQYLCARAIVMTQNDAPVVLHQFGLKWCSLAATISNAILSGTESEELERVDTYARIREQSGIAKPNRYLGKRLAAFRASILNCFEANYKNIAAEYLLYTEEGLKRLTVALSLMQNQNTTEFLRALLLAETKNVNVDVNTLLQNLSPALYYTDKTKKAITYKQLQAAKTKVLADLLTTMDVPDLSKRFYKALGVHRRNVRASHYECNLLLSYVEAAGVTQFVALTGWRSSEFGFPWQAIDVKVNRDTLDAAFRPLRFHVNWVVPKTHGSTKIEREISQFAYILAMQLHDWLGQDSTLPCLYFYNGKKDSKHKNTSHNRIKFRVEQLWQNFVQNYAPFVELRQLDTLTAGNATLKEQVPELKRLNEKYRPSAAITQLRHVMEKVENELPRILARGIANTREENAMNKDSVYAYLKGSLPDERKVVWDEYLGEDIKDYLHGLNAKTAKDLPIDIVKLVGSALVNDCAYPTPHAFRHMWAEAVFRRYSGDVGWFIRSNFKHLSEAYFMRYLRDKDMRNITDTAKRQVINSIVKHHLLSQQQENREYAGRMDAYLTKVGRLTTVTSLDELGEQVEQFTNLEITDIKSNSWGYCILKSRNQHRAKCSVDGIPQRHNASPSFCIGCTNNLIEKSHVTGIMLGIENHVQTLQIQELPDIFKQEAKSTVSNALKELKTLDRNTKTQQNQKYINHLQSALASVEQ